VGRLSSEKGHVDLLRALQLLHLRQSWKAVLVGSGPELAHLQAAAIAAGISDRVVFAGFRSDISRYFAAADVFVLPSHSEGSSNALLEAMVAGVPIVATTAGGNPEIIESDRTGLLVPAGDSAGLAVAIARMVEDKALANQMAHAAAARAASRFSPEHYRQLLCGYYHEAVDGQNADSRRRIEGIAR
jgi:glycosyltransferase involved in cell wall biosynthesis